MNQFAHFFINYSLLSLFYANIREFIIPVLVFAVVLDIDHYPGYIMLAFMRKESKSKLNSKDYIKLFRTSVQEPIGILTIVLILITLQFWIESPLIMIAILSFILHWIVDFLTVHTRPFHPIDNRIVVLFFDTKKERIMSEIAITIASLIIFLLVL